MTRQRQIIVHKRHAKARQKIICENDPGRGVSVSVLSRDYPAGAVIAPHMHGSDQLIYARNGIMEVTSGETRWVIPPQFGLWVPARTTHRIRMPEPVSMRTLYLRAGLVGIEQNCAVLHIGPLLRELILEIVRAGDLRNHDAVARALRDLFLIQLENASPVPTGIRLPRDKRAEALAAAIIADPAMRAPLPKLCKSFGVGVRTLERIFRRDIGTSFEAWRRQARLMKAIEFLVAGRSVKSVAAAVGYQEPSTFVALFRATFGTTPKAWVAGLGRL